MVELAEGALEIRLLGPACVLRAGRPVVLPRSRKVRALLAFLALAEAPVARDTLCTLLWDGPNDPRGELRWCLSKLRALLDAPNRRRVLALAGDRLALDLDDSELDVRALACAGEPGRSALSSDRLDELCERMRGELLEGVQLEGLAAFNAWLAAQRARLRGLQVSLLQEVAMRARSPAEVRALASRDSEPASWARRASIAVMPFGEHGEGGPRAPRGIADGVTEDIITRLAKLRALFVIARGTVYALGARGLDAREAGRILSVAYVVSGSVRRAAGHVAVAVELVETETARIVWTERLDAQLDDTDAAISQVVDRVVAAVADNVEAEEKSRAMLSPPGSLDAWQSYHRGLWHMYRFNAGDNAAACSFFDKALALDPTFARAHAGRSFVHFQNVFLGLTADRARQLTLAFEAARDSVRADERDPAAHWALGRARWLRGEVQDALAALGTAVELSPNFALAHYMLGFVHCQSGDPHTAIAATDQSRLLSPFDPLQFAMLASRALALLRLGELAEAADWALKAAARPLAHSHVLAIGAHCAALAGRDEEGRRLLGRVREWAPGYRFSDFERAFHFEPELARMLRGGARRLGFDD